MLLTFWYWNWACDKKKQKTHLYFGAVALPNLHSDIAKVLLFCPIMFIWIHYSSRSQCIYAPRMSPFSICTFSCIFSVWSCRLFNLLSTPTRGPSLWECPPLFAKQSAAVHMGGEICLTSEIPSLSVLGELWWDLNSLFEIAHAEVSLCACVRVCEGLVGGTRFVRTQSTTRFNNKRKMGELYLFDEPFCVTS